MQPQDGMKRRFPFDSEDLQKNFGISRPPSSFMVIVRVTINRNQSEKVLPCQQLKSRKTEAMVQRCCVPLCTSKAGDLDIYGTKVRFHRMPQSPDRFLRWCIQITDNQKYRPVLTSCSRVCSRHFRKEDYILKKPFGNNPLKISAEPCIFKWNSACFDNVTTAADTDDDDEVDNMTSIGTTLEYDLELRIHREVQCCLMDKKSVEEEVTRKNSVIEQLLGKIASLEDEQRSTGAKLAELKAANTYYERKIRELQGENIILEQKLNKKSRQQRHSSRETSDEERMEPHQKKYRASMETLPH